LDQTVAEDGSWCLLCSAHEELVGVPPAGDGCADRSLVPDLVAARRQAEALLAVAHFSVACRTVLALDETLVRLVLLQMVIALRRFDRESFPAWLTS